MRLAPWLLLLAGCLVLLLGFAADPLWPAQDAPPALARRHAEQAAQAAWIYRAGGVLLLAGLGWLALRVLRRRR